MASHAALAVVGGIPHNGALLTLNGLAGSGRQDGWVSSWSQWSHTGWYFADPARPYHHHAAVIWDFEMLDGTSFLDPEYDDLREASKVVLYSLHRWPSMRAPLKAQTINEVALGIRYWMRWLCAAGYRSLERVGAAAMGAFEEFLIADKLDEDLDDTLTSTWTTRSLRRRSPVTCGHPSHFGGAPPPPIAGNPVPPRTTLPR
jgi:hypothetical protein